MSNLFVPKNKYGNPLPRSERWGNIVYDQDLLDKELEMQQIRADLARNYNRSLTAPLNVPNPQNGNMKRNRNGTVYKWTTRTTRNNRGRPLGPHWQKVINKFGYHTNLSNAMALERKHGFDYSKLLANIKAKRGTRRANRRTTRKNRKATRKH